MDEDIAFLLPKQIIHPFGCCDNWVEVLLRFR